MEPEEAGAQPSEEYIDALRVFLHQAEGTQYWDSLWWSHTDVDHFGPFVEMVGRHLDLRGARVLDTGCGSGGLLIALAQAGATELIGVELDPNVAGLAELRTQTLPSVRILTEDASLLDLERDSFDLVASVHVVEHVKAPDSYVATIARLVRPGGRVLLACPNRFWPIEPHSTLPLVNYLPKHLRLALGSFLQDRSWLSENSRRRAQALSLYENDFTLWSLLRLLRRHGFEAAEVNPPGVWDAGNTGLLVRGLDAARVRVPDRAQRAFAAVASAQLQGIFVRGTAPTS